MYNVERAPARSPISCIIYSQRRIYIQIVSPETQPDLLPVECAACCMRAIVEKFALNSFPRCSHTELFEHEFSERNLIVPVGCASPGPFPRRLRRFQQQNKQSGSLKLAVFTERRWETRVRGNLVTTKKIVIFTNLHRCVRDRPRKCRATKLWSFPPKCPKASLNVVQKLLSGNGKMDF